MATYTFDIFATVDGYGSYGPGGDWGGYWGKQGPEFLDHRLSIYQQKQRMVFGAKTFRQFMAFHDPGADIPDLDEWNLRMHQMPATVLSRTLEGPLEWPDVTIETGDPAEVVARIKGESKLPLRSHGSLSLNRTLMAAGLVDFIQLTIFPVISGTTGTDPVFGRMADFDLELVETCIFDGRILELTYEPKLHR
jgi:dihydrofolate reductase